MSYFVSRDLYTSASGVTSETYWVGDADHITLQVPSQSTTTVQVSNDEGRTAAITNWSTITTMVAAGEINIEPGFGWMRLLSFSSSTAAILNLVNRGAY